MRNFGDIESIQPGMMQICESYQSASSVTTIHPYLIASSHQPEDSSYAFNTLEVGDAQLTEQRVELRNRIWSTMRRDGVNLRAIIGFEALIRPGTDQDILESLIEDARRDERSGSRTLGILPFSQDYTPIAGELPLNQYIGHNYDMVLVERGSAQQAYQLDGASKLPDTAAGKRVTNRLYSTANDLARKSFYGSKAAKLIEAAIILRHS